MNSFKFASLPLAVVALLVLAMSPVSCGDDDKDDDRGEEQTWLDDSTGLTWQVASVCCMKKRLAGDYCEDLSWAGFTDWRLPTIDELRSLVRGCEATDVEGECGIHDDCDLTTCWTDECVGCEAGDGPNAGCYGEPNLPGVCERFWSSTTVGDGVNAAYGLFFDIGYVARSLYIQEKHSVHCVR